ncbi:MAG: OstA-like protein [Prolixibacteraceae bacterium]|nr:OstA-like protein [Prolixibacteraceae bacterium]
MEIEQADYLEADENIASNAQRLIGNVRIRHQDVLMWCDSAYTYTGTNRVDAFGNVHINQGDTVDLFAQKIYYDGDINFARATHNVKLINKTTTLYSDTLDYDIETNIGYYDTNGKIIDSTNTLTSLIGKYLIDEDLIYFYENVRAYNDDYTLENDTLIYNTVSGRLIIQGPTNIRDSSYTLYAEDGWYNSKSGEAELTKNPLIYNETQQLEARYIKYNEEDGRGRASGAVRMEDFENKVIITGNTADYLEKMEMALVTDSALLMMHSEEDTLYLHADTLRTLPDTIDGEKIVLAYYGTRFYRLDIQGVCDSLVYFTKDSLVQLFSNPTLWSNIHQLSADMITMKQNTGAPDEIYLNNNSFIISKLDSGRFDQIKGREMYGYVIDNKLSRIEVDGNGQTLYYAREDSTIIGLNRAESSKISIQFKEDKVYRIAFRQSPQGNLKPLFEISEEEKLLSGFKWKVNLRPLSKSDVFNKPGNLPPEEPEVPAIISGKQE